MDEEKEEKTEKTEQSEPKEEDGYRKMSKTEFWIRFSVWCILAIVVPVVYLAVAYGLFKPSTQSKSGYSISGWGILAIAFSVIMLMVIISQARKGMRYASMARQCIDGMMVLLPIVGLALLIEATKDNIEAFERFLIVMICCEAVAVPINPMRKWGEQNHIEVTEGFVTSAIKKALGNDGKNKSKD